MQTLTTIHTAIQKPAAMLGKPVALWSSVAIIFGYDNSERTLGSCGGLYIQ
jgi:hypothetical protein